MLENIILVLIPKGDAKPGPHIKARPICLLNDMGKILERIIMGRFNEAIEDDPELELSPRQFGFRSGRSTVDALDSVLSCINRYNEVDMP